MNATNYVNAWIPSFGSTVVCKEVWNMGFNNGSAYLDWYDTIVSGWYLSVDLTVPIVAIQSQECVYKPEIYHFFVYSNIFLIPSIR